jgi:hypothetical protein
VIGGASPATPGAPGHTPQQRRMGAWSDGRPVKKLVILDGP